MTDSTHYAVKREWLEFWGYELDSPEAEEAWENKVKLDRDMENKEGEINQNMGIIADIKPYKSMVTGEIIHSRTKHRNHLKDHGCIEVGNETKYVSKQPEHKRVDWKPEIIRRVMEAKNK